MHSLDRIPFIVFFALALGGCSSSSSTDNPSGDGGHDGTIDGATDGAQADAVDAAPGDGGPTCGSAPFITEAVRVADVDGTGKELVQAGAKMSVSTCSSVLAVTDTKGEARMQVARGVPFYVRVDAEGHVPLIFGEENVPVGDAMTLDGHTGLLMRAPTAAALPDYGTDRPSFAIVVIANGTTSQCSNPYDTVMQVVDHPEAKAITMNLDWPTDPSPAVVGGSGSVTFFTGLAGGQYISVTGTKPGCRLHFDGLGQTGRYYLENGAFTVGEAFTADPG